jgi:ATP-dependent RNA helicase DeaD
MTTEGFAKLDGLALSDDQIARLHAAGIRTPTPVQSSGSPVILAGQNAVLHSGTGTGKTLAYLLPVMQRLRDTPDLRAVVFAPSAELALQAQRVADAFKDEALTTGAAIATTNQRRQRKRVQKSTRLVFGTADRLAELFHAGNLKAARIVVFDELEPILEGREAPFLRALLSRSEPKLQLVVASATMGRAGQSFIDQFLGADAARLTPKEQPLVEHITHHVVRCPRDGHELTLARFVQEHRCRRAIVFVADPRQQRHLYRFLSEHGLTPVTVSRDRTKAQREAGMRAFREGQARLLLTTDATARGLDVPGVEWVLHLDVPRTAAAYVHRAGRTGRAGEHGRSVVFADDAARGALKRLAQELSLQFTPVSRR